MLVLQSRHFVVIRAVERDMLPVSHREGCGYVQGQVRGVGTMLLGVMRADYCCRHWLMIKFGELNIAAADLNHRLGTNSTHVRLVPFPPLAAALLAPPHQSRGHLRAIPQALLRLLILCREELQLWRDLPRVV